MYSLYYLSVLVEKGYNLPNWLGYGVFYAGLVLELAGVAWASYRIGV